MTHCQHEMKQYQGFTESYPYCTKCNKTQSQIDKEPTQIVRTTASNKTKTMVETIKDEIRNLYRPVTLAKHYIVTQQEHDELAKETCQPKDIPLFLIVDSHIVHIIPI